MSEVESVPDMPDKQDAAAPSLTESFRQLREITTEETKQRIDEWREQREKYNDEVECLRAELQAYREALSDISKLSSMTNRLRCSYALYESFILINERVEALLAKGETPK